jgi:ubiquinone/menaquinone biosynthesis C-methylase UbiE
MSIKQSRNENQATLPRILEPEVMDSWEEAVEYDEMDFTEVNTAFAKSVLELGPNFEANVLDVGTGTARIPLLIASRCPQWQIWGIDLAKSMLQLGMRHVKDAGLEQQILLETVDAKKMPYPDGQFQMVISNSLVHHLPEPLPFFHEVARVLQPQGAILIRDLIRPANVEIMETLVASIGAEYNEQQKKLFRDSLNAALTLDEVHDLIKQANLSDVKVYQSSDRHWTAQRAWHY